MNVETRPANNKMKPFEHLYWAFVDAGMENEAASMQFALVMIGRANKDARWQAERRAEEEEKTAALTKEILKLKTRLSAQ